MTLIKSETSSFSEAITTPEAETNEWHLEGFIKTPLMAAALLLQPYGSTLGQSLRAHFQLFALAYAMRSLSVAAGQNRAFKLDLVER